MEESSKTVRNADKRTSDIVSKSNFVTELVFPDGATCCHGSMFVGVECQGIESIYLEKVQVFGLHETLLVHKLGTLNWYCEQVCECDI